MKIVKVDGTIEERPVSQGEITGKQVFKRTNSAVYLGNPVQHPGVHNEVGSRMASMYLTGDVLVVEMSEWKTL